MSELFNNGDGTFAPKVDYPTGVYAVSVMVADVNGDGRPDLATANSGHTVSVLLGNGDGTFGVATNYNAAGPYPDSVVAVDLSGNGMLDLAVAEDDGDIVSVFLDTCLP